MFLFHSRVERYESDEQGVLYREQGPVFHSVPLRMERYESGEQGIIAI